MRFYVRKRRQAPAVIIVALIDILIVLLIFLMVTTTFKQQPALKLALPEASHAQKPGANEKPPVLVSIDAQGNMRFGAEAKPVTVDGLKTELTAAIAKDPMVTLAISADEHAPWGQLVKVIDMAKGAGLQTGSIKAFMKATAK